MADYPVLLDAQHISKSYRVNGQRLAVVDNISLSVRQGEFVAIVGPSGCGKSTLLNMLAGLQFPDLGTIALPQDAGQRLLGNVGYMPQRDLLLPWRSLWENLLLGPEVRGRDRQQAKDEARELLPLFGLKGFENALPATLSGGMRQRAALLRTLLSHQKLVLLDEPFGALDALTRIQMRNWLSDIYPRLGLTMVLVTHDVDEAILLADRVLVLSARPAKLLSEIHIDLNRPRHEHIASSQAFSEQRLQLLSALGISR